MTEKVNSISRTSDSRVFALDVILQTHLLQTPVSVLFKGHLRIPLRAVIAICWPSRERFLSTIYFFIYLAKFGNGFEQRRQRNVGAGQCNWQLRLHPGTEACASFPVSRWKRRRKTGEEEMGLGDPCHYYDLLRC